MVAEEFTVVERTEERVFDVQPQPSLMIDGSGAIVGDHLSAVKHELDYGCGAVLLEGAALLQRSDEKRDQGFISFAKRLGSLQVRGHDQSPIWEVRQKRNENGPKSYSENSDVAPFHTDGSYYTKPMKYLVFLAVRPAQSGGENQILNMATRISGLAETASGKDILRVLQTGDFPFSMSPTFHDESHSRDLPLECGPVLTDTGRVRFQIKALREGFRRRPDLASRQKVAAVEAFNDFLQCHLHHRGRLLRRGQLLVINNWRSLHSRMSFNDPDRLLLRLSVSARSSEEDVCG